MECIVHRWDLIQPDENAVRFDWFEWACINCGIRRNDL